MSKQGYISLNREIQNHWLFKENRTFSKFEAWIYLLMEANHKQGKVTVGNQIVTVERGQKLTSILTMSDLFNWSRYKVKTFLNLLETDGMLHIKTTSKYTLITIVNYDFYQSEEGRKKHQNDIRTTSEQHQSNINPTSKQHQTNTNNNDNNNNNVNNDNNNNKDGVGCFDFYQSNGFGILKPYVAEQMNAWIDDFEKDGDEIVIAAMQQAVNNNVLNWNYVNGILKRWANNNVQSMKDVEALLKQHTTKNYDTEDGYDNSQYKDLF